VRVFVVIVQFRVIDGNPAQNLIGHRRQFAGFSVDERKLPFHSKS
jgi:hypothetical protein